MKKVFLFLITLIPFGSFAQNADSIWVVNHYVKKEIIIPMRDGIKLFTSVYLPENKAERHPFLLERTPYSCDPYGNGSYRAFWDDHLIEYLKRGYIMVIQDVRGKYMSEGVFEDVRPFILHKSNKSDIDEASDAYDTIDWLVKNIENNNGKVGVFGISNPGLYATMAALSGHPALKAVSPEAPVTDWFDGDDFHHNGAFFQMDAFAFYKGRGNGLPRHSPTTRHAEKFRYPNPDNYQFYLNVGALPNLTKIVGDSLVFWNQMMDHPNKDAWWQARNARIGIKNIQPAILIVGGFFDAEDCFGALNTFKTINKQSPATNSRLVMGPWFHEEWRNDVGDHLGNIQFDSNTTDWYAKNIEIPFFDFYLLGKGSLDSLAKATIFFSGENKWRSFSNWPAENVNPTNLYLGEHNSLSFLPVKTANPISESYVSDPDKPVPYTGDVHLNRSRNYMTDDQRFASRRPDVLTFETEPLTKNVTLGGPVIADLLVSISNTDADFVVKLIDILPDEPAYNNLDIFKTEDVRYPYPMGGYQMLVRAEVMRGKYRNDYARPEPFIPGKPTEVKFSMNDVAHTFKKGHHIMVQIQSSWFPLVDRNPQQFLDIYHANDKDFIKETISIYLNQSKIILPVLE